MTLIFARTISLIHLFCVVFLVFGFTMPKPLLPVHMLLIPLVILQWFFNDNKCVLTQLQNRLEGRQTTDTDGEFIQGLMARFGFTPSATQLVILIYSVMILSFLLSSWRFFNV